MQELQALGIEHGREHGDTGDVASRPGEALSEAGRHRVIIRHGHHDRHRFRRRLERPDRSAGHGHHRVGIASDQIARQARQLFHAARARVEDEVAALGDAGFGKFWQHDAADRVELRSGRRQRAESINLFRRLRPRRQRPGRGRAAEQFDELAP